MTNDQSYLVAFRLAELQDPIIRTGHYDADRQVWVGNEIASRNVVTSVATYAQEATMPFTNPDSLLTDVDSD